MHKKLTGWRHLDEKVKIYIYLSSFDYSLWPLSQYGTLIIGTCNKKNSGLDKWCVYYKTGENYWPFQLSYLFLNLLVHPFTHRKLKKNFFIKDEASE